MFSMRKQPTEFTVNIYSLTEVFGTTDHISSLATYSEGRQKLVSGEISINHQQFKTSSLFLEINAAADYFTTNHTLMQQVPLVTVDISASLRANND